MTDAVQIIRDQWGAMLDVEHTLRVQQSYEGHADWADVVCVWVPKGIDADQMALAFSAAHISIGALLEEIDDLRAQVSNRQEQQS